MRVRVAAICALSTVLLGCERTANDNDRAAAAQSYIQEWIQITDTFPAKKQEYCLTRYQQALSILQGPSKVARLQEPMLITAFVVVRPDVSERPPGMIINWFQPDARQALDVTGLYTHVKGKKDTLFDLRNAMTLKADEYRLATVTRQFCVQFTEDERNIGSGRDAILMSRQLLQDGDVLIGLIVNGQPHKPTIPIFMEIVDEVTDSEDALE